MTYDIGHGEDDDAGHGQILERRIEGQGGGSAGPIPREPRRRIGDVRRSLSVVLHVQPAVRKNSKAGRSSHGTRPTRPPRILLLGRERHMLELDPSHQGVQAEPSRGADVPPVRAEGDKREWG